MSARLCGPFVFRNKSRIFLDQSPSRAIWTSELSSPRPPAITHERKSMRLRRLLIMAPVLLASIALAANPQDEAIARNAYAKLAYAVQARIVYIEVQKNPDITTAELAKKLQANELRFEITDLASGAISDIGSKPYSDFVAKPDKQEVLQITHQEEYFDENGKRATSYFAIPHWSPWNDPDEENWDIPVSAALVHTGNVGRYSRYVAATITARFQGRSRTYHALWWFSDSDVMCIDTVTGNSIVRSFAMESAYPSVLTDTSLRSRTAVNDWLNSTQRFESSCKAGKLDVCCDSALHRGVSADDLRSTKPAPNTTAAPKEKLQ
jgi:hypothetical protein